MEAKQMSINIFLHIQNTVAVWKHCDYSRYTWSSHTDSVHSCHSYTEHPIWYLVVLQPFIRWTMWSHCSCDRSDSGETLQTESSTCFWL